MKRAVGLATDIAVRRAVRMMLYILIDKHDAPIDEVQQLSDELSWLGQMIDQGRISWGDVDRVLEDNNLTVYWR